MLEFKYDTQLLIEGENLDEDKISEYFTNNFNGDCLLAVGDEELIKIYYVGEGAYNPIISEVASNYKIQVNIIHGNIDYIHKKPFGILLLKIKGNEEDREKAKKYIKENVYKLEIIK